MKLNKFIWNNYKETKEGKETIELFKNGDIETLFSRFAINLPFSNEDSICLIDDLYHYTTSPRLKKTIYFAEAKKLLAFIYDNGITLTFDDQEIEQIQLETYFSDAIAIISSWLYLKYPDIFKPYFFKNKFDLLTKIAYTFDFELPDVPLKKHKKERFLYYIELCHVFSKFQKENGLTNDEFCAFLYDFGPNFLNATKYDKEELPEPTQVWWIGGDKSGGDFEFLDNASQEDTSFWQGNVDTRKGDILVMYCLSPRSYIHSVWRATKDGIADPFFHYYSNIYIGLGQTVPPITIQDLKKDNHFSKNPLVRKNLQGINGYPLSSEDYLHLQEMFKIKGFDASTLPQLYSYIYKQNKDLKTEREVEINLIEPFLKKIGYQEKDWIRQLPVRMGRGERNFPDYAFLSDRTQGYEKASMIIESKFNIKNNKELEDTFKQVWSYGQRLSAKTLAIMDKDTIWIYFQNNDSFNRNDYIKYFWKELDDPDKYNKLKILIGK